MTAIDTEVQIAPKSAAMKSILQELVEKLYEGVEASFDWAAPPQRALLSHLQSQHLLVPFDPTQAPSASSNLHARLTFAALASWRTIQDYIGDTLRKDTVSDQFLFGIAVEYYFVTSLAVRSISKAARHGPMEFRSLVRKMIVEEYGHDRIMRVGLEGFGASASEIQQLVPLAYTRALLTRLANAAKRDPRVFSVLIFLFEYGAAGADEDFESHLQLHGAPAPFVNAVREHNRINAEGQHCDASAELFCALPQAKSSMEDSLAYELWLTIRMFANQSKTMLQRYGESDSDMQPSVARYASVETEARSEAASVILAQIYSWCVLASCVAESTPSIELLARFVLNEDEYPDSGHERVRPGAPVAIFAISDLIDDLAETNVGEFITILGDVAEHLTNDAEAESAPLQSLKAIAEAFSSSRDLAALSPGNAHYYAELLQILDAELRSGEVLGLMPVLSSQV